MRSSASAGHLPGLQQRGGAGKTSMQHAAGLALRSPKSTESANFAELDRLLAQSNAKNQDLGKHLSGDITGLFKSTKHFRERAAASERRQEEEDLANKQAKNLDSKQLFNQIEDLLSQPELGDEKTTNRVAPTKKDMEILMSRVASESKLLTGKYPIEVLPPAEETVEVEIAKAEEIVSEVQETAAEPISPEQAPAMLAELEAMLVEAEHDHQENGASIAATLTRLMEKHSADKQETHTVAEKLLRGDEHDDEEDPAHLEWRRGALHLLKKESPAARKIAAGAAPNGAATRVQQGRNRMDRPGASQRVP